MSSEKDTIEKLNKEKEVLLHELENAYKNMGTSVRNQETQQKNSHYLGQFNSGFAHKYKKCLTGFTPLETETIVDLV